MSDEWIKQAQREIAKLTHTPAGAQSYWRKVAEAKQADLAATMTRVRELTRAKPEPRDKAYWINLPEALRRKP